MKMRDALGLKEEMEAGGTGVGNIGQTSIGSRLQVPIRRRKKKDDEDDEIKIKEQCQDKKNP